jgi:hypothetical protein
MTVKNSKSYEKNARLIASFSKKTRLSKSDQDLLDWALQSNFAADRSAFLQKARLERSTTKQPYEIGLPPENLSSEGIIRVSIDGWEDQESLAFIPSIRPVEDTIVFCEEYNLVVADIYA